MKKLLSLCLVLSLMLTLSACGSKSASGGSEGKMPAPAPSGTVAAPNQSPQIPDTITPTPDAEEPLPVTPEVSSPVPAEENPINTDGIDIDLSQMSGMMAYAELSSIIYYADDYVGKVIRITGTAMAYHDEQAGTDYYAVVLQDATACCASGFDLLLADGQEPPKNGQEITVTGELEMYEVYEGIQFLRLKDAVVEAQS